MRRSEKGHPARLVAAVGVLHATDLSFGRVLLEELERQAWPGSVVLEDLSYCPLRVYQRLEEEPLGFQRAVFVGAETRGRPPGTLELRRWRCPEVDDEELQGRIADAYMGIVDLDNLLIICDRFGSLPGDTLVVEIEPAVEAPGTSLSPICAARMGAAIALVRRAVEGAGP